MADGVRAEMERLAQRFPDDVEYKILYDTTKFVDASIREVIVTLWPRRSPWCVAVTFLFLGDWRSTLIPGLAIPVSLIGTFAVLLAIGYLGQHGLALRDHSGDRLVVDDAIVVVENVQRLMDDERGSRRATRPARPCTQVQGPVIATTLVLLAVFVPVMFLPGITGQLYKQFAVTISVSVLISSINALTLEPGALRHLPQAGQRPAQGAAWAYSRASSTALPRRLRPDSSSAWCAGS